MENTNTIAGSKMKKRYKLLIGMLSLVAVMYVANLVWRGSGSNEWEFELDKDGVQVYSLKTPGNDLKKFKGTVRIDSSMGAVAKLLLDTEGCDDWFPGCTKGAYVEEWSTERNYYINAFQMPLPLLFKSREFVLKTTLDQDPASKEIFTEVIAMPDSIPESDCCYRVQHMHNTWRFTPLENGKIEVNFLLNLDVGGYMPDILFNLISTSNVYVTLDKLEGILGKDKYRGGQLDFIVEP